MKTKVIISHRKYDKNHMQDPKRPEHWLGVESFWHPDHDDNIKSNGNQRSFDVADTFQSVIDTVSKTFWDDMHTLCGTVILTDEKSGQEFKYNFVAYPIGRVVDIELVQEDSTSINILKWSKFIKNEEDRKNLYHKINLIKWAIVGSILEEGLAWYKILKPQRANLGSIGF